MWFIVRALISRSAAARRRAADRELTSSNSSPVGDTRTDGQQEIPPHTPPSQAARPMSRTEPVSGAQYLRSSDYLPQDTASVTIDESTEETSFFDPADSIWAQKSADTSAHADEYSRDDAVEQTPAPTRAPRLRVLHTARCRRCRFFVRREHRAQRRPPRRPRSCLSRETAPDPGARQNNAGAPGGCRDGRRNICIVPRRPAVAGITLTLTIGDGDRAEELFVSRKPWLHPLFDLSGYLGGCPYSPSELVLYDTVTGRASALLVACIGIKTLVTGVISAGGEEICALYGITYRAREHIRQ